MSVRSTRPDVLKVDHADMFSHRQGDPKPWAASPLRKLSGPAGPLSDRGHFCSGAAASRSGSWSPAPVAAPGCCANVSRDSGIVTQRHSAPVGPSPTRRAGADSGGIPAQNGRDFPQSRPSSARPVRSRRFPMITFSQPRRFVRQARDICESGRAVLTAAYSKQPGSASVPRAILWLTARSAGSRSVARG
jgi:hypothetical protein